MVSPQTFLTSSVLTKYTCSSQLQVRYRAVHKPYNLDFIPSEFTTLPVPNPDVYKRVVLGLEPGTQYEIKVSAETRKGEGSSVSVTGYTEPKSGME